MFHRSVISTKRQMALTYSYLNQYGEAIRLLDEIVRDNKELYPFEEFRVFMDLSMYQYMMNLKRESIDTLNKFIELCNKHSYLKHYLKYAQDRLALLKK